PDELQRLIDRQLQLFGPDRLGDVVDRARLDGSDRVLDAGVSRQHDQRDVVAFARQQRQELEAGEPRHPVVGDDEVHFLLRQDLQRLGHALGTHGTVAGALQRILEDQTDGGFVVDVENGRHLLSLPRGSGPGRLYGLWERLAHAPAPGAAIAPTRWRRGDERRFASGPDRGRMRGWSPALKSGNDGADTRSNVTLPAVSLQPESPGRSPATPSRNADHEQHHTADVSLERSEEPSGALPCAGGSHVREEDP